MDADVRLHGEQYKGGDNPIIGLVLCSEKSEALRTYQVKKN